MTPPAERGKAGNASTDPAAPRGGPRAAGENATGARTDRETAGWEPAGAGVLVLPSGLLVRGRGLRNPMPSGHPPTLGVYLLGEKPPDFGWESRWVPWPDFRLPRDPAHLRTVLLEVLDRAGDHRVELACSGGRGRTGTALACLAVLDGVPADGAVTYVRERYDPRAVETPWQRRFVRRFDET